jgi:hypothetical protein
MHDGNEQAKRDPEPPDDIVSTGLIVKHTT